MKYDNKQLVVNIDDGTRKTVGQVIDDICHMQGFGVTIASRAKYAIHSNTPYSYKNDNTFEYIDIKNNSININGTIYRKWYSDVFKKKNNNIKNNNKRKEKIE